MSDSAPGVQQILGNSGACPEIPLDGKVWRIGHPTQRAKAVLEELAAGRAVAEVRALKGVLPPDAYSEMFTELTKSIAAGDFKTWHPGWQRVTLGGGNSHLFLLSLLRECHPSATEADALRLAREAGEEVTAAMARVIPGFFDLLLAGLGLTPDQQSETRAKIHEIVARLLPTPPTASS